MKRYSWLLVPAAIAVLLIVILGGADRAPLGISAVGLVLGLGYFYLQQRLAETILFKQLFTEFNRRYDELNDTLTSIKPEQLPDGELKQKIVDYFNLCAEEYLYYREGYIRPDVWRTWCRGMLWYLDRKPFDDIWAEEVKTDSYYGLSIDVIKKGARPNRSVDSPA